MRTNRQWALVAAATGGFAVFALLAYLVGHGQTMDFDLAVRSAVHAWASPALTVFMRLLSVLGSGYFLVPFGVIPIWHWVGRGASRKAYVFAAGSLSAEAVSELLKMLFHRPRPEVFFGLVLAQNYSFPSGHAFVSTVYFGLLAWLLATGARGRAAVIVLAAFIGTSRVYLGYHYPSDVVAGWALASIWLALCAMKLEKQPE